MLNFFYMYAVIWGGILLFYSFGWSNMCAPLAPELLLFFVVTIIISLVLGYFNRRKLKFQFFDIPSNRNRGIVVGIVVFCVLEFVYCRQVPLFYIIFRNSKYTEYTGIPTLHSLMISFGSFYAQYLMYRFLQNRTEKSALIDYIVILIFIYLLQFNRGGLMIAISMSLLMFFGMNSKKKIGKLNRGRIIIAIIIVFVMMFGFGALGNLRHGYSITNSGYIQQLGQFNDSYPAWLPKQFMWAYIYIVSPVANLNYNVMLHTNHSNVIGFIMTFIPDFISRRIYSGKINAPRLVLEHVFNATAGFGTAYVNAGIWGMYFLFFYLMFGLLFLWKITPIRKEYRIPCLAIMNIIVIFMFFTHTIYYSAISFQIIFPLLSFMRIKTSRKNRL